ncbi:hypothetical protein KKA47_01165 [bacterium]|nr:hypothetical protein [bacterium]
MYFTEKPASESLYVNTDPEQHYVIQKSEEDGIQDLRRFANSYTVEEAWVFVEGLDQNNNPVSFWYEVGENETFHSVEPRMARNFEKIVKDLEARNIKIISWTDFHIHPEDDNKFHSEDFFSMDDYASFEFSHAARLHNKWKIPPQKSKMVSPYVIATMALSEKYFQNPDFQNEYDDAFFYQLLKADTVFTNLLIACYNGNDNCIIDYNELSKQLSSEQISVTFRPFDQSDQAEVPYIHHDSLKRLLLEPINNQIDALIHKLPMRGQNSTRFIENDPETAKIDLGNRIAHWIELFKRITNTAVKAEAKVREQYHKLDKLKKKLDFAMHSAKRKAIEDAIDILYRGEKKEVKVKLLSGSSAQQNKLFKEIQGILGRMNLSSNDQTIRRFNKLFLLIEYVELQVALLGDFPELDNDHLEKIRDLTVGIRSLSSKVPDFIAENDVPLTVYSKLLNGDSGFSHFREVLMEWLYDDRNKIGFAINYLEQYSVLLDLLFTLNTENESLEYPRSIHPGLNNKLKFTNEEEHNYVIEVKDRAEFLSNYEPSKLEVTSPDSGAYKSESQIRSEVAADAQKLQNHLNDLHETRTDLLREYYSKDKDGVRKRLLDIKAVYALWFSDAGKIIMNLSSEDLKEKNIERIRSIVKEIGEIGNPPELEMINRYQVKLPYPPESFIGTVKNRKRKNGVGRQGNEKKWKQMIETNQKYMQALKLLAYDAAIEQINQVRMALELVNTNYYYTEKLIGLLTDLSA